MLIGYILAKFQHNCYNPFWENHNLGNLSYDKYPQILKYLKMGRGIERYGRNITYQILIKSVHLCKLSSTAQTIWCRTRHHSQNHFLLLNKRSLLRKAKHQICLYHLIFTTHRIYMKVSKNIQLTKPFIRSTFVCQIVVH